MRLTDDLTDKRWLYLKGFLFLLAGTLAAGLLLAEQPTLRHALLLAIALWAFCRWYYFLFYVIEKYTDGAFKFAGLGSFLRYLLHQRAERKMNRSSTARGAKGGEE